MEVDPSFKQVIPYLVLRDGERYFLMRRTRAGVDARLHDRYSIGVGGHLNPGDGGVLGGLRREWHEELVADFEPAFRLVGLLNDDTTEVGAVHLGAVYVADAAGRPVDDPRDRQAHRLVRGAARGRRGRRQAGDLEPPLFRVPRSSREYDDGAGGHGVPSHRSHRSLPLRGPARPRHRAHACRLPGAWRRRRAAGCGAADERRRRRDHGRLPRGRDREGAP